MADTIASQIREYEARRRETRKQQFAPLFYGMRLLEEGEKKKKQDLATYNAINEQMKLWYKDYEPLMTFEEARKGGMDLYQQQVKAYEEAKQLRTEAEFLGEPTEGIPLGELSLRTEEARRVKSEAEKGWKEPEYEIYYYEDTNEPVELRWDKDKNKYFDKYGKEVDRSKVREYTLKEPEYEIYYYEDTNEPVELRWDKDKNKYFDKYGKEVDRSKVREYALKKPSITPELKIGEGGWIYETKIDQSGKPVQEAITNITPDLATKYNVAINEIKNAFREYHSEKIGKRHGLFGLKGKYNDEEVIELFLRDKDVEGKNYLKPQIDIINQVRNRINIGKPRGEQLEIILNGEDAKNFIIKDILPEIKKQKEKTELDPLGMLPEIKKKKGETELDPLGIFE